MVRSGARAAHCAMPLVFLMVVLAGCVGGDQVPRGPDVGADASLPTIVLPWGLYDCTFAVAFVPTDAAALAPFIPDGFTLAAGGGPLAPVLGSAYIGIEAFACASGEGANGTVDDMQYGSFFTSVEPPADLAVGGIFDYYLKWDTLVPDVARRDWFGSNGTGVRGGWATVDLAGFGSAVGGGGAALHMEGIGHTQVRYASAVDAQAGGATGAFAEFSPLEAGRFARWQSNYTVIDLFQGRAAVTVPAGSLPATVWERDTVTASINVGQWSFHDGSVTVLPARAVA